MLFNSLVSKAAAHSSSRGSVCGLRGAIRDLEQISSTEILPDESEDIRRLRRPFDWHRKTVYLHVYRVVPYYSSWKVKFLYFGSIGFQIAAIYVM